MKITRAGLIGMSVAVAASWCVMASPRAAATTGNAKASDDEFSHARRNASDGERARSVSAVAAHGRVETSGLSGTWSRIVNPKTGESVATIDVGVYRSAEGFDGKQRWRQDPSGGVHHLNGEFARRDGVTLAWLAGRGWLERGPDPRVDMQRLGNRRESGRTFSVVSATPRAGQPVELWFDARTHLLDRAITQMPTSLRTVSYGDYRAVAERYLPFRIETRDSGSSDVEIVRVDEWQLRRIVDARAFAAPSPPNDVALVGESTTVPLEVDGYAVVRAALNGREFDFILDTGGHNIITPEAAAALGVRPVGAGATGGAGAGEIAQQDVRIDRLAIGAAVMRDQHFYVVAFPHSTVERGTRPPLAGILGLEIFERFQVEIDYPGRHLTLRPSTAGARARHGVAVPIVFDDDMPLVEGRIDGKPGLFALDTGNGGTLVVQQQWAQQHGMAGRMKAGIETVSFGAGGASVNWASRIDRLDVGGVSLPDLIARYAEDKAGAFSSRTEAANIGTDVLAHFVLDVDYEHGVIWFDAKPGYVSPPFPRSGLRAVKEDPQSFRVLVVTPNSPAAEAGILRDDRIVAVDGVSASELSGRELAEKFVQPVGTVVALTVRREASERVVQLRLVEVLP